jgi:hypothetical protein
MQAHGRGPRHRHPPALARGTLAAGPWRGCRRDTLSPILGAGAGANPGRRPLAFGECQGRPRVGVRPARGSRRRLLLVGVELREKNEKLGLGFLPNPKVYFRSDAQTIFLLFIYYNLFIAIFLLHLFKFCRFILLHFILFNQR